MTEGRLKRMAVHAAGRMALVALCLLPAAWSAADEPRPVLTIVIDDLGWDSAAGERTLALPNAVTVAILPGAPASSTLAELAARSGHEIMLHQPMEALDARWPGPGLSAQSMMQASSAHASPRTSQPSRIAWGCPITWAAA